MDIKIISQKNIILNNLFNDYLYCKQLSDSLKNITQEEINVNFKVVCIRNNKLIIFVENSLIAAKLKIVLSNIFAQWKKNNNYKFKGFTIKISN